MTSVLSMISYEDGVGKTTITANLAAEFAYKGSKVLLIDLDPQSNLTTFFLKGDYWEQAAQDKTIKNWFEACVHHDQDSALQDFIISPSRVNHRLRHVGSSGKIDLIASHQGLIDVDKELRDQLCTESQRTSSTHFLKIHSWLKVGLAQLETLEYDVVLIDCSSDFHVITKIALAASDHVFIPAKPVDSSIRWIEQFIYDVTEFVAAYHAKRQYDDVEHDFAMIHPKLDGVIFTMVAADEDAYHAQEPYLSKLKKRNIPVLETMIREHKTIYGDVPRLGVPLVLEYVTLEVYQTASTELEKLAVEVKERIGR